MSVQYMSVKCGTVIAGINMYNLWEQTNRSMSSMFFELLQPVVITSHSSETPIFTYTKFIKTEFNRSSLCT